MEYEFFFSYARANNDAYLRQFFDDLCDAVREKRGYGQNHKVSFFDQQDLELGADWDAAIVEGLQTCKVVVAIGSPAYFSREDCGREWELFRLRCEAAVGAGQPLPPLIKPVRWLPFEINELPQDVRAGQAMLGNPQAVHNVKGIKHLLKRLQDFKTAYEDVIDALADQIVDAGKKHSLPALAHAPRLQDVVPAFPLARAPAGGGGVAYVPPASGPKHVRLVYVAADPHRIGNLRKVDPYQDMGGADWKPFFPEHKQRIHSVIQNIVSSEVLDFSSDELAFGPNLVAEIAAAWQLRQIVILIVDGWSLDWDQQYRAVLSQLDGRLDYHWCVLVPWNENDAEIVARREAISKTVSDVFDRHRNLAPNPMFYREGIKSVEELQSTLQDVLTRLKEEIKKRAEVQMPVPQGPSRAILTGPSAKA